MVETGTVLQGRFVIEEQIGQGGMGAVYIATDNRFGSRVAIKERRYEDPELALAFEREARLLNSLHHPILPHVSDYFSENGRNFLVMEYIDGDELSAVLAREGAFPVDSVVRWTLELLDGLDYLHSQEPPIIHRDIKPGNLKITPRGNIVLLDFGLAKESANNTLGGKSVFGYSRRYSPLEQIEGTGTDPRSDIFSLGATVYHLITGKPPTEALARASAIVAGKPDPLTLASEENEQVPHSLAVVINSALALNAEQRFVSAAAVRAAIQYAIGANPPAADLAWIDDSKVVSEPYNSPKAEAIEAPGPLPARELGMAQSAAFQESAEIAMDTGPSETGGAAAVSPVIRQKRVRVRFIRPLWQRPLIWAAAALGFLLLFSYIFYRSGFAGRVDNVPGEQAAPASASAVPLTNVSEDPVPDEPQPALAGDVAESKIDPVKGDSKSAAVKQPIEAERPKPVGGDKSAEPDPRPTGLSVKTTSKRGVQPVIERPRIVKPSSENRSPAYSIETIITGLPSPGQAWEGRRPRRQLSAWEQEQLRRQRFEDMIRTTRRWRPPF